MTSFLLFPFIAFFIVLLFVLGQMYLMSKLAAEGKITAGKAKPYACGEDVKSQRINPDYSQFFPFAFFFTVMHVVVLMLATIPSGPLAGSSLIIASLFLIVAFISLFVLFRR